MEKRSTQNTFINKESIEETIKKLAQKEKELNRREKLVDCREKLLKSAERRFEKNKLEWMSLRSEESRLLTERYEFIQEYENRVEERRKQILKDYDANYEELEEEENLILEISDKTMQESWDLEDLLDRVQDVFHLNNPELNLFEDLFDVIKRLEKDPEFRVEYLNMLMKDI